MQTVKLEDGTEIETYTAEELEQQKQEAIETYKAENPDKTEELTTLQEELQNAKAELEKLSSVDKSVSHFKKEALDAQKKVAEITKDIDEKINNVKREVLEGVMKDHYNETLETLSGGDEELKKKIEFNFKRLGDVASTKAEMSKKFQDAARLAGVSDADAVNTSVFSSGGVGRLNIKGSGTKFTPDEVALGAKFGLKPEDFKGK